MIIDRLFCECAFIVVLRKSSLTSESGAKCYNSLLYFTNSVVGCKFHNGPNGHGNILETDLNLHIQSTFTSVIGNFSSW